MRSQSFHDKPRELREDNARHVVKSQPADVRQRVTTLVTRAAVREDESLPVLTVDMVAVTNQSTLGRIRPIADEDMAVGGAEEVQVIAAAEITAIVETIVTIDRTSA